MVKEKPKRKQKRPSLNFGVSGCFLAYVFIGVVIVVVLYLLAPVIGDVAVLNTDDQGHCKQTIIQMAANSQKPRLTAKDLWTGDLEPLTPDNAPQLREAAQVGRGYILNVEDNSDGELFIMTSTGLWQQATLDDEPVKLWDYAAANKQAFFSDNAEWVLLRQYDHPSLLVNRQSGASVPLKIDQADKSTVFWKPSFSPDAAWVADIAYGNVYVWDTATGELAAVYTSGTTIHVAAFAPDSHRIAISLNEIVTATNGSGTPVHAYRSALHVWNSQTKTLEKSYPLSFAAASIVFDKANSLVIVDGSTKRAHRLNLADGSITQVGEIRTSPTLLEQYHTQLMRHYLDYRQGIRWLADGSLIVRSESSALYNPNMASPILHFSAGASNPSVLRVCQRETGKQQLAVLLPESSNPFLSPDGTRLWNIEAKQIQIYDTTTFALLEKLPQPDFAHSLLFLPTGEVLAAKLERDDNDAQILRLWNARSGEEVARLALDGTLNYGSSNISLSPDGTRLVLVDSAGVLRVWGVVRK